MCGSILYAPTSGSIALKCFSFYKCLKELEFPAQLSLYTTLDLL